MPRSLVASVTITAMLVTGCAAERPWPAHPVTVATGTFARHSEVRTIDVLPLDLQMWAEPGYQVNLDELRAATEVNLMNVALETLAKRDYAIGAMIDWNGDYPGGNALSKDDLLATVGSLARYGAAAVAQPGQLPTPFLPARLGTTTGADATLYVGGWSYVAKPQESTGDQIAEAIFIGLIVVAVVAIIAIATSDKKSHRGHHSSGGGHVARHGGGLGGFSAARGIHHRSGGAHLVDAFGHAAIDIALTTPDWGEDPTVTRSGSESQMYLEMTLVDNHTGLALWHAHQSFPASAASASETARVAHTMLSLLPGHAIQAASAR